MYNGSCVFCSVLSDLHGRRFYVDNPDYPFFVLENLSTLTPVLIWKEHIICEDLQQILIAFHTIKDVCNKLYDQNYYVHMENNGHTVILSGVLLSPEMSAPISLQFE